MSICLLPSDPGVKSHNSTLFTAMPDPERTSPSYEHDLHLMMAAEPQGSMKWDKRPSGLGWVKNYVGIRPYPGTPSFLNCKSSGYDLDNSDNSLTIKTQAPKLVCQGGKTNRKGEGRHR